MDFPEGLIGIVQKTDGGNQEHIVESSVYDRQILSHTGKNLDTPVAGNCPHPVRRFHTDGDSQTGCKPAGADPDLDAATFGRQQRFDRL